MKIAILGGGIFGVSAAAALAKRGHHVELFEQGDIPSEKAASNDISKALRLEYGTETHLYTPLVVKAREAWLELEKVTGLQIYHETGVLCFTSSFAPGGFEYESFHELEKLGFDIEVLNHEEAEKKWPCFDYDGIEHLHLQSRWRLARSLCCSHSSCSYC